MIKPLPLAKPVEISEFINQLPVDLKAEVLVAAIMDGGNELKDFLISYEGQLQRSWSRDIALTDVAKLETGDQKVLLHLNRDGIYDMLPEAIFHSDQDKDSVSGKERAKDSLKLRMEEKETRSFFQPFENEIFYQRVRLSDRENQLGRDLFSRMIMGLVPDFWNISEDLPEEYVHRMVRLLPLVHRIAGSSELTSGSLEFILNEMVNITSVDISAGVDEEDPLRFCGILGSSYLGFDSVCGNRVSGDLRKFIIRIGPVRHSRTDELIKNGGMEKFLKCFYDFFIPVGVDTETRYLLNTEDGSFILGDTDEIKVTCLGYNSIVQ